MSEKYPLLAEEEGCFFLTSPFIERIIKGRPSRQAVAASREGALARVPTAAVAVKDLRPLRGAHRTRRA
jgi:hypothetical protein